MNIPTATHPDSTLYLNHIKSIHHELGISWEQVCQIGLPLHPEASHLISIGLDSQGRTQYLSPKAAMSWHQMQQQAQQEGIELNSISGFRSVTYQAVIFQRKLQAGSLLEEILKVNAPPGFSEHHTGRALDIGTPDCSPVQVQFENTPAFAWLLEYASDFHFELSYPENNPHGITYEPWHWCYQIGKNHSS